MSTSEPKIDAVLESAKTPDAEVGTLEESQNIAQRHPKLRAIPTFEPEVELQNIESQNISESGLHLIENFEGYSFNAYWDSYGNVWTVGYGETTGVGPNTTMTRAQAEADLRNRLASGYEWAVRGLGVPLNQNQFDALCSFVWNLGPGSMSSSWTIGRYLRERNYQAAADSMMNYVYAGGVRLQGLVNRREAERRLFLTPAGPPPPPPDPHHYVRFPIVVQYHGESRKMYERNTVETYDRLRVHGIWNRKKLKPLRVELDALADNVAWAAGAGTKHPDWKTAWRWWRFQQLIQRAQGKKMA